MKNQQSPACKSVFPSFAGLWDMWLQITAESGDPSLEALGICISFESLADVQM